MRVISIAIVGLIVCLCFTSSAKPTEVHSSPALPDICPAGMVHVSGEYCTEVKQECKKWREPPCSVKQTKFCLFARCEEFAPSVCVGERVHKDFCADVDEYTKPGETLPLTDLNYFQAEQVCKDDGKRLCKETEWEFACEGQDMLPHTTGYSRPTNVCNIDIEKGLGKIGRLNNLAKQSSSLTQCVGPFGTRNQNGNVDEWTTRDRSPDPGKTKESGTHTNALKGGWWSPVRDRCRPATTAHDDNFHEVQVGFRCCKDVK